MTNEAKPIRVFFSKTGRAKYISHLDMARCVQRALKRTKLNVWHTQGYNPHMYINFSLALSLGFEGLDESFEIKMLPDTSFDEIKEKLNAVLPLGIKVTKVALPIMQPKEIGYANYDITLFFDNISKETLKDNFEKFLQNESIITIKKSKSGDRKMDIKPYFSVTNFDTQDNTLHFEAQLAAGVNLNINPTLITNAFCEQFNLIQELYSIKRTKILNENLEHFE